MSESTHIQRVQGREARPARRGGLRAVLLCVALVCALGSPLTAQARDEYDPTRAGNPLKIVYYVAYPVAFTVDWLIFRPAYFIGSYQPFRALFGREPATHDDELPPPRPRDEDGAQP